MADQASALAAFTSWQFRIVAYFPSLFVRFMKKVGGLKVQASGGIGRQRPVEIGLRGYRGHGGCYREREVEFRT